MARGGRRTGRPGVSYNNRTDLQGAQPVRAATGQPYGQAQAQQQAQRAVPLPQQEFVPPNFGAFDRPTEMPHEPVTAGLPVGAGPGPEILNPAGVADDYGSQLRAVYSLYPNNDILRLIEEMDTNP